MKTDGNETIVSLFDSFAANLPPDHLVGVSELARALKMNASSVRNAATVGSLKAKKLGAKIWFVTIADAREWVNDPEKHKTGLNLHARVRKAAAYNDFANE